MRERESQQRVRRVLSVRMGSTWVAGVGVCAHVCVWGGAGTRRAIEAAFLLLLFSSSHSLSPYLCCCVVTLCLGISHFLDGVQHLAHQLLLDGFQAAVGLLWFK